MRIFKASLLCLALAAWASAAPVTFTAVLDGATEGTNSPGTGSATVVLDTAAQTMSVAITFQNLLATTSLGAPSGTTASHIHCCTTVPLTGTAGVATQTPTFVNFPLGVTSGSYNNTFDMSLASSYNAAFITANGGTVATALAALAAGMTQGRTYVNIHTTQFPGGEIRGFLVAAAAGVPEPGTIGLVGSALSGAFVLLRRRRS